MLLGAQKLMTFRSDHDRLLRSAFICIFASFGHYGHTARRDRTSFGGPVHFRVASCRPAQSRFLPALPGYARENAWSDMVAGCSESSQSNNEVHRWLMVPSS